MAEDRSNGMAWFLAGLSVGALVGILYAPKSGRETREDIAQGARDGADYLRDRSRQAAESVGEMVDKGKEQVSTIIDKSKDQVSDYVDRGREVVDRGRAQWEEFVERGKNLVSEHSSRVTAAVDRYRIELAPRGPGPSAGVGCRASTFTHTRGCATNGARRRARCKLRIR
jgi:gas vesicle protein